MTEQQHRVHDVVASGLLLVPLAVAGFGLRHGALYRHHLDLDEWHTLLVSRQQTLGAVLNSLARGGDFNPPLLFVWQWLLGSTRGGITPAQLRLTALACVWLALTVVYLLLRRVFGTGAALVGALFVLAGQEVIRHAFNGRFYGPWLLLTVLYVAAMVRVAEGDRVAMRQTFACLLVATLCLLHYFGVITVGLVCAGIAIACLPDTKRLLRSIAPSLVTAALMLVALYPMYQGQRTALSVATWIWPPTAFTATLFVVPVVLGALGVAFLVPRPLWRPGSAEGTLGDRATVLGLCSLGVLPLILTVFSFAVQSVMLVRYALPAFLVLGVLGAALYRRTPLVMRVPLVAVIVVAVVTRMTAEAVRADDFEQRVVADSGSLQDVLKAGGVIAVASPTALYPLLGSIPNDGRVLGMAVAPRASIRRRFPVESDSSALGNALIAVQDVAAADNRLFRTPSIVTADSLARLRCFYLLELWDEAAFAHRWLPHAEVFRLRPRVFLIRTGETAVTPSGTSCGPTEIG